MTPPKTAQKTKTSISDSETSYDAVPYKGHTYPMSHPRHLATIAQIFGLPSPPPDKARILEIGCASGSNLIPIAAMAPGCTCLGIDLSARQIEEGRQTAATLGLKNIIFETMSVTDIPASLGPFDYIICHGVFSWVPPAIQKDILRVCSENLTPDGLAYISYNTLPGWNAVRSIREMMLYHTAQFAEPSVKVDEALKMMRFVVSGLKNEDNVWRRTIENELKIIEGTESWYVYHEHLENENHPLYFHDFMTLARAHKLQYVGDAHLSTMYVGALAKDVADTLSQLTDIVRQEQYMDFVRNRRFRSTILTHAARKPDFTVPAERMMPFLFSAGALKADFNPAIQDWRKDALRTFNGGTISSESRPIAALLATLCEQPRRLFSSEELIAAASEKLGPKAAPATQAVWNEYSRQLCFLGYVAPALHPYTDVTKIGEKPQTSALVRYQAKHGNIVTNARHESVRVDKATLALLPLLDGKKTVDELAVPMLKNLEKAGAQFIKDGTPTTDPDRRLAIATEQVKTCLQTCLANKLLIG